MKTTLILAGLPWLAQATLMLLEPADKVGSTVLVTATPSGNETPERCPFVVRVAISNSGTDDIDVSLDLRDPLALEEATSLLLMSSGGRAHRIHYTGRPQGNRYSLPVRRPMAAGTVFEFERVFAPLSWGRKGDVHTYSYEFLPPGDYSGKILISYSPGRTATSNPFDLRVTHPANNNKAAGDKITVEIAAFLYGGEPPSRADGPARLLLEDILNHHPDSAYAEWIRFWKVYHDGPAHEALEYARQHQAFPLSDNLMLRMAEGLVDSAGKHDRDALSQVRAILAEMQQLFPNGDTKARADLLRDKLTKKP